MKRKGFIKSLFLGSAGALVTGEVFSAEPKNQQKHRLMVDFIAVPIAIGISTTMALMQNLSWKQVCLFNSIVNLITVSIKMP